MSYANGDLFTTKNLLNLGRNSESMEVKPWPASFFHPAQCDGSLTQGRYRPENRVL